MSCVTELLLHGQDIVTDWWEVVFSQDILVYVELGSFLLMEQGIKYDHTDCDYNGIS